MTEWDVVWDWKEMMRNGITHEENGNNVYGL